MTVAPRVRSVRRASGRVVAIWVGLLLLAGAAAWATGAAVAGGSRPGLGPEVLVAPVVGAAVLAASWRGAERLGWVVLMVASVAATLAWTSSLSVVAGRAPATLTPAPETPLTGYLLGAVREVGGGTAATSLALTVVAAGVPALAAITVRSLAGAASARVLLPVLVLAPYAVLVPGNAESLAATAGAGALAVAAVASEAGREPGWRFGGATGAGVLLGVAALLDYAAILLAVGVLAMFFVRRRALLNAAAGIGCLVPLLIASSVGFDWTRGAAQALARDGQEHRVVLGVAATVLAVLLLCGPGLLASAAAWRTTPAWPLLTAGGVTLAAAAAAGVVADRLAPGTWLPALPWVLVAAAAPLRQGGAPARTPLVLVAVGGVTAYGVALAVHAVA